MRNSGFERCKTIWHLTFSWDTFWFSFGKYLLNFKGPLNMSITLIFGRLPPNNTRVVYINDDILYFSAKEFDNCILPFSKINWIRNRIPKCTLTKYHRQPLSKFDPKILINDKTQNLYAMKTILLWYLTFIIFMQKNLIHKQLYFTFFRNR